jgi:hypothetical protein
MKIQVQLKDIVHAGDDAINHFGLNPWCLNEGSDGDCWYEIEVNKAVELGIIIIPSKY